MERERLDRAYQTALAALLAERTPEGYWIGELSTSALSTATAVVALALVDRRTSSDEHAVLIHNGLAWLAAHQNSDGGWGDTDKSFSNISTTMLCRAAFHLCDAAAEHATVLGKADVWLGERYGRTASEHADAVRKRYGKDRTFAVPILTMSALAGLVEWREVPPLPFELACFPQSWFRFLQLPVVSYALPALIAIGQAVHYHRPSWNPLVRLIRNLARKKSLEVLLRVQPSSGGFLEATPLTSFVTMSLASIGLAGHPVALNGVRFIVESVRPDGSWPIDTNLSTWVTTLAINALGSAGELERIGDREKTYWWLLRCQYRERHPYTGADPGGWGWTRLSGSVPDADDTPGALLALACLNSGYNSLHYQDQGTGVHSAVRNGFAWLSRLQNRDGGWPTFCRGWGALPFDRSGTDLTAHVLRAINAWAWSLYLDRDFHRKSGLEKLQQGSTWLRLINEVGNSLGINPPLLKQNDKPWIGCLDGLVAAHRYLERNQRSDGSWLPLWFGNQHAPNDENPTYGTARVLAAYRDLDKMSCEPARRGVAWLLSVQNPDGGWGGAARTPSSIEETSLAVEVLLAVGPEALPAVNRGLAWLVQQVEDGGLQRPTPIGFYFAKLWYYEKLYPIVFAVAALGRARRVLPDPPCAPPDGQQGRHRDDCR